MSKRQLSKRKIPFSKEKTRTREKKPLLDVSNSSQMVDRSNSSPQLIETTSSSKPLLVVLPGASGSLVKDMTELLIPALQNFFQVRVKPPGKWKGWDPVKNARHLLDLNLFPSNEDKAPWFLLGVSFGNRVAAAVVAENMTAVAPGLIMTGYPMYGPKGSPERVDILRLLPASARVLAISGDKDEFINKNAPAGSQTGRELWEEVAGSMPCGDNVTVQMIPNAGHGCFPAVEGQKNDVNALIMEVILNFVK